MISQFSKTSSINPNRQPCTSMEAMNLKVKMAFLIFVSNDIFLISELEYQVKKQEAKLGRLINQHLVDAAVVLGTFMNCSNQGHLKNIPRGSFSLTVVDECSQAKEASIWILEPRTNKLVLAGDYHQLPPTVKNKV